MGKKIFSFIFFEEEDGIVREKKKKKGKRLFGSLFSLHRTEDKERGGKRGSKDSKKGKSGDATVPFTIFSLSWCWEKRQGKKEKKRKERRKSRRSHFLSQRRNRFAKKGKGKGRDKTRGCRVGFFLVEGEGGKKKKKFRAFPLLYLHLHSDLNWGGKGREKESVGRKKARCHSLILQPLTNGGGGGEKKEKKGKTLRGRGKVTGKQVPIIPLLSTADAEQRRGKRGKEGSPTRGGNRRCFG